MQNEKDIALKEWSKEQLVEEIIRLRNGIREHRDSTGHDLCWHHPKLWNLLPEKQSRRLTYRIGRSS